MPPAAKPTPHARRALPALASLLLLAACAAPPPLPASPALVLPLAPPPAEPLTWSPDERRALEAAAPDADTADALNQLVDCHGGRAILFDTRGPTPDAARALDLAHTTWRLGRARPTAWPDTLPATLPTLHLDASADRVAAARLEGRLLLALTLRQPHAVCPTLTALLAEPTPRADDAPLRRAYARYAELHRADALGADWLDPALLPASGLGLDDQHPLVPTLRVRLAAEGFLTHARAFDPQRLDADTLDALHTFLDARGLEPHGRLDTVAVDALNVPPEYVLVAIEDALAKQDGSARVDEAGHVHLAFTRETLPHRPWLDTWMTGNTL